MARSIGVDFRIVQDPTSGSRLSGLPSNRARAAREPCATADFPGRRPCCCLQTSGNHRGGEGVYQKLLGDVALGQGRQGLVEVIVGRTGGASSGATHPTSRWRNGGGGPLVSQPTREGRTRRVARPFSMRMPHSSMGMPLGSPRCRTGHGQPGVGHAPSEVRARLPKSMWPKIRTPSISFTSSVKN